MLKFASIDPGKWSVSVAIWTEHDCTCRLCPKNSVRLTWAGLLNNPHKEDQAERAERWGQLARVVNAMIAVKTGDVSAATSLILEIPQVYGGVRDEDPNDLIDLAGVQGAIVGVTGAVVEWSPLPREWKGQLPKEVSAQRVEAKLTEEEKRRIEWPAKRLRHNVYDAIHMGIVFLERYGYREFRDK